MDTTAPPQIGPRSLSGPAALLFWSALGVALALPRILRLFWPQVWVEDVHYLHGAFAMAKGWRPYFDFTTPNLNSLEWVLSLAYRVFGPGYRVAEVLTAGAVFGWCLAIYALGARLGGRLLGAAAALALAWHPLVFRYHVFEREIYTGLLEALALLAYLPAAKSGRIRPLFAGVLLGLSFCCKQTALFPLAVLALHALLLRRSWRQALSLAAGAAAVGGLAIGYYWWRYGAEFWLQVYTFHLLKGANAPLWQKMSGLFQESSYLALPGVFGLLLAATGRERRRDWAAVCFVGASFLALTGSSATFWPHYALHLVPYLALGCGMLVRTVGSAPAGSPLAARRPLAVALALALLAGGGLALRYSSLPRLGFGGIERAEVAQAGRFLQGATDPEVPIMAHSFVALAGRRLKLINYEENLGVVRWIREARDSGTLEQLREQMSRLSFGDVRVRSKAYWIDDARDAILYRAVSAVVPDDEFSVSEEFLRRSGYELRLQTQHYAIWIRQ